MEPINRQLLKTNAKEVLKHNFWMVMLIVFVGSFLGANWSGLQPGRGSINIGSYGRSYGNNSTYNYDGSTYSNIDPDNAEAVAAEALLEAAESMINTVTNRDFDYQYNTHWSVDKNMDAFYEEFLNYFNMTEEEFFQKIMIGIGIFLLFCIVVNILATCIRFAIGSFLCAPIGVGYRRYFMKNRKQEAVFTDLFSSFNKENYMRIVKTMFSTNIRIFGWSLLFYFPGVVKYYQYYFVNWIMAENPTISKERAREISKTMTDGHKWQIFVLGLSFIGWYMLFVLAEIILGLMSCGLLAIPGAVLVFPINGYVETTMAELYAERREWMLVTGNATNEELKGF